MNWQSQMMELLAASLIRPVVLAAAAWLILRVYKVRHPASRHAVWTAVLIGMMVLPLVSVIAPQWKLPLLPKKPEPVAHTQIQAPDFTATESSDVRPAIIASAPSHAAKFAWPAPQTLIVWVYFAGVLAMTIFRLMGWALLLRIMSKSRLLRTRLLESNEVVTPVTVGVLRPSVILPAGWRDWSASTKHAVLTHEFAHIRRRDTLTSSLTRLAKCIYWFHPLAWWVSRQVSELAELSCDAAALEKNGDPGGYSRILLGFAETVNAAGYRAAVPGLAIASRSGMGQRIDQVFELADGNLRRLSRPGTVLAFMGVPVMCIAAVVGLTTPASRVFHQAAAVIIPSQPVVVAQLQQPGASPVQAPPVTPAPVKPPISQSPRVPVSGFDVASIKPCSFADAPLVPGGRGGGGGRSLNTSPGRLNIGCMTVSDLINVAYKSSGDPLANDSAGPFDDKRLRGGPAWVYSERYTIEAATDSAVANGTTGFQTAADEIMSGPMLQRLLEERFRLQTHREVETIPAYALTAAKSGFKLKPMAPGDCIPDAPMKAVLGAKPRCGWTGRGTAGPNMILVQGGVSLSRFSQVLGDLILDRHVVDDTGIAGTFVIQLEYSPDDSTPDRPGPGRPVRSSESSDIPPGPTIFTALEQQLGLRLESTKTPHGYIVIDRVERPSEN